VPLEINPFLSGLKIVDCGDIPVTPYDNAHAIKQIEAAHRELLHRTPFSALPNDSHTGKPLVPLAKDGKHHPRVITLGGDHTIVLPLLRSIHSAYGPISVIHFDSHLDSWKPSVFGGAPSAQAEINHGTYFYWASLEGLIANGSSVASIPFFLLPRPPFSFSSRTFVCELVGILVTILLARRDSHDVVWPGRLRKRRRGRIPPYRSSGDRHHW
jgi:agmatinase